MEKNSLIFHTIYLSQFICNSSVSMGLKALTIIPLTTSYGFMIVSQLYGPEIIDILHGLEAKQVATSIPPVLPNSSNLCNEYEIAHYHSLSNILHVSGMICLLILIWLMAVMVFLRITFGFCRQSYLKYCLHLLIWCPPLYYLPAWIGHFIYQKDIPAVFSYGTTLEGWYKGELCAFIALWEGRALSNNPSEYIVSTILAMVMILASTSTINKSSPSSSASSATTKNSSTKFKADKQQ